MEDLLLRGVGMVPVDDRKATTRALTSPIWRWKLMAFEGGRRYSRS